MSLTQQAINELKQIHKKEFGEELTNEEAMDMGYSLLRLFKAMTRKPISVVKGGSLFNNAKQNYDK